MAGSINGAAGRITFTSAEFKVTPDELRAQSVAVSNKVQSIRTRFNEMERTVSSSNTFWNGEAADNFRSVYAGFKDEIAEILSRLSEHITDLEKMAGVYETAENAVNETIESLPSDVII
ncbi:MAG: WXG100 family type VII secretion target [Ruminococcaceae bacterium]|nr:WXG100 family type VII secretion target [Oscillospiraceae bacterium]